MSTEIKQRLEKLARPKEQWTPVDEALYGVENLYRVEAGKAEQLRFDALKYSFNHHYQNNGFYHRLCQREDITPADIKEPTDLLKIPLIPDTFFKDYPAGSGFYEWLQKISSVQFPDVRLNGHNPSFDRVIDTLMDHNFTITFTSGSSGRYSFFPRDELTWLRQRYSFASMAAEVLRSEYEEKDPQLVMISTFSHPFKTNLFTGKVFVAVIGTLVDEQNAKFLINRKLTTDMVRISMGRAKGFKEKLIAKFMKSSRTKVISKLINLIETYSRQGRRIVIVAPPFLAEVLFTTLETEGKKMALEKNAWLVTGGGWKLPSGGAILGEQWRQRVETLLGIPPERYRDLYGMSECSAAYPDCEGHYKHIPHSIVYPFLLDDQLKPIKEGNVGRLAFLDPMPNSYPGFIITGDKVRILKSCPVCDRPGPVFDADISRIGGAESRGCAEIAGQLMSKEIQKAMK